MRAAAAIALIGIFLGTVACAPENTEVASRPETITSQELADRIAGGDAPFILDVRTKEEFAKGHLPGAINVPHTEISANREALPVDHDGELVVMCEKGGRARVASAWLNANGYTALRDLEGHMSGWRSEGREALAETAP